MVVADDGAIFVRENDMMDIDVAPMNEVALPGAEALAEETGLSEPTERERRVNQRTREAKILATDLVTTLRNTDLARWNNEYKANMVQAAKQKQLNRLPTIAKKNAAYWVFGKGIGAVGNGLDIPHIVHPLKSYSGEELYEPLPSSALPLSSPSSAASLPLSVSPVTLALVPSPAPRTTSTSSPTTSSPTV